jgi:chromosome segregation ATPase
MKLALVLLGLVAINAVFVKKAASDPNMAVFTQLEQIEETEMGKKLLDTIALQMKNKAPLQDIAKMLQDLRENLILQQQEADLQHAANMADCELEIAGYNRRIQFASNEITEASNEIQGLTQQSNFLTSEIENKIKQLAILDEQETALRENRAKEHEDFKSRQVQTPKVIEALDVIATKLGSIEPEGDAEAVLAELHRIGGENPILALVQLASTFSAEKLQSVQDKIAELRASLEQSIIDDREAETQAQLDFEQLIVQFAEQRNNLSVARTDAETKLVSTNNQLSA